MDQLRCSSCIHFRQHYVFHENTICSVHCGHCVYGKSKTKKPDAKACEQYVEREPDEAAFVSREYLSHALLEYMMKLV
mgnify:CR=1 FL=1